MTFNTPTVFNQGDARLLTERKHILSATKSFTWKHCPLSSIYINLGAIQHFKIAYAIPVYVTGETLSILRSLQAKRNNIQVLRKKKKKT